MAFLTALLIVMLATTALWAAARSPSVSSRIDAVLRRVPSWLILLALAFALIVGSAILFDTPAPALVPLGFGALVLLAITWTRDFTLLMGLPDEAFPGRHDKLIWAMLLVFLPPVGMVAFWSYRRARGSVMQPSKPVATDWS